MSRWHRRVGHSQSHLSVGPVELDPCSHLAAAHALQILEVDVDDVPWKDKIVTHVPPVVNGVLTLPNGPGWGVDVDEEELARHPPLRDARSGIWK